MKEIPVIIRNLEKYSKEIRESIKLDDGDMIANILDLHIKDLKNWQNVNMWKKCKHCPFETVSAKGLKAHTARLHPKTMERKIATK